MAKEVNDQNFDQEIIRFEGVALVDFWAPWCGPCKMQGPIIDEVAEEFKDNNQIKIVKLNVDDNNAIAQEYQVMSIPTLKIFKAGKVADETVGLQSKESLIALIKKHVN